MYYMYQLNSNLDHYRQASFPEAVIVNQIIQLDASLNLMEMALNEDQMKEYLLINIIF